MNLRAKRLRLGGVAGQGTRQIFIGKCNVDFFFIKVLMLFPDP